MQWPGSSAVRRIAACATGLCSLILAALVSASGQPPAPTPRFDVLVAGGTLIDGSGKPGRRADVAIKDGRIANIGLLPRASAREAIDATGLVVAPGFIDVHTHADSIADTPRAENFVRMGVTSLVAGNCGGSALDVGEALTAIRQAGISVNYATLVGHNTVRTAVMGTANREPTLGELARMKSLVWRAMADGAVGLSTGLQYVPGTYARTVRDRGARARGRQRRRPVRLPHAERGDRAREGDRGDDSRRRSRGLPRADLAPES